MALALVARSAEAQPAPPPVVAPAPAVPTPAAQPGSTPPPPVASPPVASPPVAPAPTSALPDVPTTRERVTLEVAIQRALARNPSAAVAAAELRRAEALVTQARAASLPTLTATGIYTRLDAERRLGDRVAAARDQLSANVTLAVPILAPQRWAHWSHAADDAEATRASTGDTRRQVALATARAYLGVVASRRVLEAQMRARTTAQAHLTYAETRFAGGLGHKLDSIRAAQEVATDEAAVQSAASGLVRSQEALGVLLGAEGPVDATDEPALRETPPLESALGDVRDKREDVRAAELRIRAAEHQVRDGWTDYAPLLVGTFQPFYQNPPSLVQPQTGWQAQLVLTLPLYDGGLRYGLQEEREADLAAARAQLESTLSQARADARSAFAAMRRADDALRASRDAARLAHEALQLADLAYRAGATTNLDVIDAERRARDADTQVAVAEDEARLARLDFLGAVGRFP
jgi:outer membrane protein TolC